MSTVPVTMPTGHTLRVLEHRARAHNFETWEAEALRAICSVIKPGSVVFDVGAEEGEFSALYGLIAGPENVHMFEPTPSVWPNIRAVWEANHSAPPGGMWPGFVGAATDTRGPPQDLRLWPACANGEVQRDSRFSVVIERPDIPCLPLDAAALFALPDVVVVDVEGAECRVVEGSERLMAGGCGKPPHFFVSVHPPEFLARFGPTSTQEHLFRAFSRHGYSARWISTDHESHWHFAPPRWTP